MQILGKVIVWIKDTTRASREHNVFIDSSESNDRIMNFLLFFKIAKNKPFPTVYFQFRKKKIKDVFLTFRRRV